MPKRPIDLSATKLELADKKIELVDVKDLRFDPKNPRLPSNIDGTDERQVFSWMLAEGNIPELMASIGAAGYFRENPYS